MSRFASECVLCHDPVLVAVMVPEVVPAWVGDHFRDLSAALGESAFAATELPELPDDL